MKNTLRFLLFSLTALVLSLPLSAQRATDRLDRGLVAMPANGSGTFVSWRIFGEEYYDVTYNLYRNGTRIATNLKASNYTDSSSSGSNTYQVAAVVRGVEQEKCAPVARWGNQYLDIPMQKVVDRNGADVTSNYTLNDVTLADVDGDGIVEFIVKRPCGIVTDLSNKTAFHILDCYTLSGRRLWWIDLGPNMLSGADEQWDCVGYDWDGDGKAEILLRGQDNMIIHHPDGTTTQIGNMNTDTRWDGIEYTSSGNEYLLYLEGATAQPYEIGEASHPKYLTYPLPRGNDGDWGSGIVGHRSTKHFFGAPFLDGRHASLFLARGIYTKEHMKAFDVDPLTHKLTLRWEWKSDGLSGSWFGQGYHNYAIADVDWDGRDEIVYGSMVIDDNGKGLHTTGLGHGDAQHCGDLDPFRHGQEQFACNESSPNMNYRNATTGQYYYRSVGTSDDGRALMGNFTNSYPGCVGRSVSTGMVSSVADKVIGELGDFIAWSDLNNRIYWDGDLLDEVLNSPGTERDAKIEKPGTGRLLTTSGCKMNNWSKNNPGAQADIMGDWREEIVLRTADDRYLRVYVSPHPTTYSLYTLWHDHQYRQAMVWQPLGYNQPPHVSYFVGELEGYTQAPPPLTLTDRTVVEPDGTIGTDLNDRHVLLCETGDAFYHLAEGATPYIITDNTPSWVQGSNDNNNITTKTYFHSLSGTLSGATRLVKQGDGRLVLSDGVHPYSGRTDIWGGELCFETGYAELPNTDIWMNRFTTLSGEVMMGGTLTMEYGARLVPELAVFCACPTYMTVGTLAMHIGSRICYDVYDNSDVVSANNDFVKVHRLEIQTKDWQYGPEYMAPIFDFSVNTKIQEGKFCIMEADEVDGDLDAIILKGVEGKKAQLVREGTRIYLVIEGVRDAAAVAWSGAQSSVWDFARTANFLTSDAQSDVFVGGDDVLFSDDATTFAVELSGELPCDTVTVRNTTAYTFSGSGALTGSTVLVKEGTGKLTISTDNSYTGGNHLKGGTVSVSSLANSTQPKGNLGAVTTNANLFTIEDGATLQTTAAVTCDSPIKLVGDEGGIISNSADFVMNKAFSGTKLTKKGGGWLKLYTNNTSLATLVVSAGTVATGVATPAKAIQMTGGTLNLDGNSSIPIDIAEGRSATVNCNSDRGTYTNKLTGKGTVTIYYPLVKGNDWYATRASFAGTWASFEGTVKPTGVSGDGRFCLNNGNGMPKGTLNIASGITVENTAKTFKLGAVTGSGTLGGVCSLSSSAVSGNNTWQVGLLGTDFEFGGKISGGATRFEKVGDGTMTLTGSGSNHTGTNSVSAGTLCLNNSKATAAMLGTGTLTVASGAMLSGQGMLANAITVNKGGTLRPGIKENSMSGKIDCGGKNVTLVAGATLQLYASSGTMYTRLTNVGRLLLKGTLRVLVRDTGTYKAGQELQLWDAATTQLDDAMTLDLSPLPEGLYWDIADLGDGILRITDDPELAIHTLTAEPVAVAVQYYDLSGKRLTVQPTQGLYLVRTILSDGTTRTEKRQGNGK